MKVKTKEQSGLREVNYYGIKFLVPSPVRYLAADKDGELFGYINKPVIEEEGWWLSLGIGLNSADYRVAEVDLEGLDWKDSLLKVGDGGSLEDVMVYLERIQSYVKKHRRPHFDFDADIYDGYNREDVFQYGMECGEQQVIWDLERIMEGQDV